MNKQREFFNKMAEKWDEICLHDDEKIKYILNLLDIKKEAKILDIGTGTGVLLPHLVDLTGRNSKIMAIDVSENMIKVARSKFNYSNVEFLCEDIMKARLPYEYFDYIICYSVFPHFKDQKSVINLVSKYLNRGGKILIGHSQSRNEINKLHKRVADEVSDDYLPTIDTINNYYKYSGLKTITKLDNEKFFVIIAEKTN